MTSSASRPSFKISIFLSYPKPYTDEQIEFVDRVRTYLDSRGFAPRTLGVTDYDIDAPLKAIRRLMLESNGLITIAFRRAHIGRGTSYSRSDSGGHKSATMGDRWLTTPWAHIEPAMAYQIGLPILLLREKGVIDDGILEKGVVGTYLPEFDADGALDDYFSSPEWTGLISRWEGQVRSVVDKKGNPPPLY